MHQHSILLLNHHWLASELRALGHKVFSAALRNEGCDLNLTTPELPFERLLQMLPDGFVPDRIVYYDDSGVPWLPGLEDIKIPKIFYSIDTFHHHHWHAHFAAMFDAVLVAQKDYLKTFEGFQQRAFWFPLWALRKPAAESARSIDAAFVGTLNRRLNERRVDFFEKLGALFPVTVKSGDWTAVYPHAKIVVNQTVLGDLNFRVFEALISGALLVTPEIENGLGELFTPGLDLITYREDDPADAADKIRYYLQHEDERSRIAESGYRKTLAAHTAEARARKLSECLGSLSHAPTDVHYTGAGVAYLATYFVCQHEQLTWGKGMLLAGANALIKGASRREGISKDFAGTLALYKHQFEALGEFALVEQLLESIRSAYPRERSLLLIHIHALKRQGKNDQALDLCRQLSPDAHGVFSQIDQLLGSELGA